MDEQPVALATTVRSPNSWLTIFTYGVSPQPAQAPENSNSGVRSCVSFTTAGLRRLRSKSGRAKKKSQLARSASRSGGCGAMLSAFRFASLLFLTGQTSTHRAQPVQSSGATCNVYFISLYSFHRAGTALKAGGAPSSSPASYTFERMTAWGHTSTHFPHWMQIFSSHTG